MEYEIVIGLEIHVELSTKTKIYCSCKNHFGSEVNANCCPICSGMPGTLPTLNKTVVDYAIKMGHALGCSINRVTKQDRKNYFYPDLPKAYQISQFDIPLCEHGELEVVLDEKGTTKKIGVTRIHIEEDAGKLIHDDSFAGSLVDMNRCGVPLIEIVSEPDMRNTVEAKAYLETIKSILQYLDISDCKMQEGSIRCDVNVSVMPKGSNVFGTRCEMKNVNSFSAAVRGIEYESKRQIEILENGGVINQETRRWDDAKGQNFLLRTKEDAQDYRFFKEPDLLTIVVSEQKVKELKEQLPELPNTKMLRYMKIYNLSYVESNQLIESVEKSTLFEACIELGNCQPKNISNWILSDISKVLNEKNMVLSQTKLTPSKLFDLITLVENNTISNSSAKIVLDIIMFEDRACMDIVNEKGLSQISDSSALEEIAKNVLNNNATAIEQYKSGKTNVLGFLVGQCMKESKGQGNPAILKELVINLIENN